MTFCDARVYMLPTDLLPVYAARLHPTFKCGRSITVRNQAGLQRGETLQDLQPSNKHTQDHCHLQYNRGPLALQTTRLTAAFFWLGGTIKIFWICIMAAMVAISLEQPKFPDSSSILANMGLRGNSAMRTPMGSVRRPY